MAKDQPLLFQYGQYLAVRAVAGFMPCFDVEQNLNTAATIGSAFCALSRSRRQRAIDNIAASFPEWECSRVVDITERSMQHMFQLFLVDALLMPRLVTQVSWPQRIRLQRVNLLMDRLIAGDPVILVTGHCGNWELLGHSLAMFGYPLVALARPLDNRFLNRWLLGIREATGTRILTKWGATPARSPPSPPIGRTDRATATATGRGTLRATRGARPRIPCRGRPAGTCSTRRRRRRTRPAGRRGRARRTSSWRR